MASRRRPRLLLALLLLWQLNATAGVPHVAAAIQADGAPATHCERHLRAGLEQAGQPADGASPQVPDCCRDVSAGCHCAQLPALAMTTLEFGETPPPAGASAAGVTRRAEARGADFFRPPI